MRVGIMGGTFDPIHQGHLLAAELAREAAGLDEVWFMPSYSPPHKESGPTASAEERLHMVRLAVEGNAGFQVTDIEIVKRGTSYTAETMDLLTAANPHVEFSYIIGADMVMYLPKWYRIMDLVSKISFIGLKRPGYTVNLKELPEEIQGRVQLVPMVQIEVSSTEIRSRLKLGKSVRYMIPEAVRLYMGEKGIYE